MTLIHANQLSKSYPTATGAVAAVDAVSLDVAANEFVSVVGPSGCGKSTLMLMLAGLVPVSDGTVAIGGKPVTQPFTDVGIVFQDATLLEWRTVLENVMLQIEVRGYDPGQYRERACKLLHTVGLDGTEGRLPHELSGGQRQRVALVRALIHQPALLLMDEPFGALDALSRDQLNLDLQDVWRARPTAVVFITHSISEAVFLSDRILVMTPRPGRIAANLRIDLPRPRPMSIRETPAFGAYAKQIRGLFEELGVLRRGAA